MATFIIRKGRAVAWRVLEQWTVNGAVKEKTVPIAAYKALGFNPDMSRAEATQRASQLNTIKSLDASAAVGAARRVKIIKPKIDSIYLPANYVSEFELHLESNTMGTTNHARILKIRWGRVQMLISELQIEPHTYSDNSVRIHKHLRDLRYSPDYCNKLISILNKWGLFICKKQGRFYEPVENARGQLLQQIAESYSESRFYRAGGSPPLTPNLIKIFEEKLPAAQVAWLKLSLWFGLRPGEVTAFSNPARTEIYDTHIRVYQPKLVSLPKPKRWKTIPLGEPEQIQAIEYYKLYGLKRPLAKTLKRHADLPNITCYAGRKGFADLMLQRGHSFINISLWMGHQTVDRTWKNYKLKG
jgi:integrase